MPEPNNKKHPNLLDWFSAARIRTLPLAMAVVGMGNFIHFGERNFRMDVLILSMVTTVFLQVLSNFANDLGDSRHGADHSGRQGPARMVQQGKISSDAMKKAAGLMALLSLISGTWLLITTFSTDWTKSIPLFCAGLLAIAAAWFYTNGKRPYGYLALGDLAVFLFFGLLAVSGSAWLQKPVFLPEFLLPATAAGFWSVAVLNLNNMRDFDSDKIAGKISIPLLIGLKKAKIYQCILVAGGGISLLLFGRINQNPAVYGAIPGILLMSSALYRSLTSRSPAQFDKLLKPQAVGTFLAVLGMYLAALFF